MVGSMTMSPGVFHMFWRDQVRLTVFQGTVYGCTLPAYFTWYQSVFYQTY